MVGDTSGEGEGVAGISVGIAVGVGVGAKVFVGIGFLVGTTLVVGIITGTFPLWQCL